MRAAYWVLRGWVQWHANVRLRPCLSLIRWRLHRTLRLSQPDPKLRTIEGVLFDALIKVGAVSKDNSDNPTKVREGKQRVIHSLTWRRNLR